MSDDHPPASVPRQKTLPPPVLPPNPTSADVIIYLRALAVHTEALAWAQRIQSTELGGIRSSVQEQGGRIESFCSRIERALDRLVERIDRQPDMDRSRDTDPPKSVA